MAGCECKFVTMGAERTPPGEIQMCPLHRAAPELLAALQPFVNFLRVFEENPPRGLDPDEIYSIHGGEACGGASLKWEHLRAAREALRKVGADEEEIHKQKEITAELLSDTRDTISLFQRLLNRLVYIPGDDPSGHPHGYSVGQIPEWEIRQKLEWLDASLAKAEGRK